MPREEKKDNLESLRKSVEDAKVDLLLLAEQVDPLRPVKSHPAATLGCALAGGFLLGLLRPQRLSPFLPLALEAGELLLKRANARYD